MVHLLRSTLWLTFFGLILVSWWMMVSMSTAMGLDVLGRADSMGEMIDGAQPDHPVMIFNSKYWMGPDIIAAVGVKSKVRDYGRVWDFGGKSAEICPIDWKGAA